MNNMNKRTFLSLLLCVCCLSFLHAERVDMQQAGADVQGRKLNTALINSTIDRLNAHGGGTLFFLFPRRNLSHRFHPHEK